MEDIIDKIIEIEWNYFTNLNNTGGRASCQDNYGEFVITRKSQWENLTLDILKSYYDDLMEYKKIHRNPLFEKYAYMMEFTHKDEYEKLKPFLPLKNERNEKIIDMIEEIVMKWEREFVKKYPVLAKITRGVDINDEGSIASTRTYLRGEHSTYSVKTNELYLKYIQSLSENLVEKIYTDIFKKKGFVNLEDAENIISSSNHN